MLGFQHRQEAERFLERLRERLGKFGLELHTEKTRLIEFGRYAAERRKKRGKGKPNSGNMPNEFRSSAVKESRRPSRS